MCASALVCVFFILYCICLFSSLCVRLTRKSCCRSTRTNAANALAHNCCALSVWGGRGLGGSFYVVVVFVCPPRDVAAQRGRFARGGCWLVACTHKKRVIYYSALGERVSLWHTQHNVLGCIFGAVRGHSSPMVMVYTILFLSLSVNLTSTGQVSVNACATAALAAVVRFELFRVCVCVCHPRSKLRVCGTCARTTHTTLLHVSFRKLCVQYFVR